GEKKNCQRPGEIIRPLPGTAVRCFVAKKFLCHQRSSLTLEWARRFEGGAAAAGPRCIRINDLKTSPSEGIAIIQGRATQQLRALFIDKKFHAVTLDHGIARTSGSERHLVLQTGTTALCNSDAQSFFCDRAHQCSQLPHRTFGNFNHSLQETYDPPSLSQSAHALPCRVKKSSKTTRGHAPSSRADSRDPAYSVQHYESVFAHINGSPIVMMLDRATLCGAANVMS